MTYPTVTIDDTNLSYAWARAVAAAAASGVSCLAPLTVSVSLVGVPYDIAIAEALDKFTRGKTKIRTVNTSASTIFPETLWNPQKSRDDLYERYMKLWPRIKRCNGNQYGTYFKRMISFQAKSESGTTTQPINQLEDLIIAMNQPKMRASRMQLVIVDPSQDMTNQALRGFPCLQQVSFVPLDDKNLMIGGAYATQYLVNRAYGNYLGLYRLGQFVASQTGRTLVKLTCTAMKADLGCASKSEANLLISQLRQAAPRLSESLERDGHTI